jgi:hypothetical protein
MVYRPMHVRALASVLAMMTMIVTAPFSLAETVAAPPLGTIVTQGSVTIGNVAAPTGTTIFAGDRVASTQPALINLGSGSRLEMTKAAATFARQGEALLVQADQGLIRFNFKKGEDVQIEAGKYRFTTANNSEHIGELGLNRSGQVVMNVAEGTFLAMNTATGMRTEVSPATPFAAMDQSGHGSLTKGGKTVNDGAAKFQVNELKGRCLVSGSEAHQITANTANVIEIKDPWKLNTGTYEYKVVDCSKDALIAAGASTAAAASAATAGAAAGAAAAGAGAAAGVSAGVVAGVVAGVAGAVGLGIGVYEATKSDSSR